MRHLFLFVIVLVAFSCGQKQKVEPCQESEVHLLPEVAAFDFKKGSQWVYVNQSQVTATMTIFNSPVSKFLSYPRDHRDPTCSTYKNYDYREIVLTHNLNKQIDSTFLYCLMDNNIFLNRIATRNDDIIQAKIESKDTLFVPSAFQLCDKIHTENIFQNFIVQNRTFPKVVEVKYTPSCHGFRTIWWAENVGFVKVEIINEFGNPEIWELKENKVVF